MSPDALSSFRRIILALFPWLVLAGFHTYRVRAVNGDGTIDLDPPPASIALPPLPRVAQWTIGGGQVTPAVGSEVTIIFRDNDESRPAIVSFVPLALSKPTAVSIDATTTINLGGAGATALAKANAVANNMSVLLNALSAGIAHAVPNDGGAAMMTAIVASLAGWPATMATTKVEGK